MTNLRHMLFQPTVALAFALMGVIIMMILPMPALVLDIGLATSFAVAILIFTITLFIERPLDFSAFPTVLLASLMLRLALNVSSTKLIIGQGHTGTTAAGNVIAGFADFVMGGSVFQGLVVFGVLLIVNFVVINKGATRMAEVGARFALDAMPGKQLAIDADMSAGAISHQEASERRAREQAETTFFGSLDGASKFVKGDAVAGLLITALNLLVGLIMGTVVHGMDMSHAFETYAILTVGDGLVSQIPAVIISIASALLLARGGASGSTDVALMEQLGRHPAAIGAVGVLMAVFALVPGLPVIPFLTGAVVLGLTARHLMRRNAERAAAPSEADPEEPAPTMSLGDILDLDDIHLEFATDLVPMVLDSATGLDSRIRNMRNHIATEFGIILPEIRLTDTAALPAGAYVIRIQGVEIARDNLHPDQVLALLPDGTAPSDEQVCEPVYGAPAIWIDPEQQEEVALQGMTVVNPGEVLATHLLEVIRRNLARLMTLRALRRLLDEMMNLSDATRSDANRRLIESLIPDKIPMEFLLSVLKLLLDEVVSIRNMAVILETVAEARQSGLDPVSTAEHVRQRLGFQLVAGLKRPDGSLPLIQMAPEWEDLFAAHQIKGERGAIDIALPPDDFNRLAQSLSDTLQTAEADARVAIVTSAQRRRFLHTVVAAKGLPNPVLAFEELGIDARPALLGTVAA